MFPSNCYNYDYCYCCVILTVGLSIQHCQTLGRLCWTYSTLWTCWSLWTRRLVY